MTPLELFSTHIDLAYKMAAMTPRLCGYTFEDVRQEALIHLWRAAKEYRADHGAKFSTFAVEVIKKKLYHTYTDVHHNVWKQMDYPTEMPITTIQPTQFLRARVSALIGSISEHNKPLLFMRGMGCSFAEIAEELGISSQAVQQRFKYMRLDSRVA